MTVPYPLEPDAATLRRWIDHFAQLSIDHLSNLTRMPAGGLPAAAARARASEVRRSIDEHPMPGGLPAIGHLLERAAEASLLTPGPGYLAYVPGGGLPTAAIAELVASLLNRYTGLTPAAPGFGRLEADVLEWLAAQMGYDAAAAGLLCSGGSMANLSAIVTARHELLGEQADLRRAVVYTSSQAHHSIIKAVRIAGLPKKSVRAIAVDERLRLCPGALVEQIRADRDRGLRPFLVVSAAGTTNTGAIDPLPELADVCRAEGLWHHVDGAYGGAFALCDEGRRRLAGIERADSITFDPHKGLFLPYGTGCLLVRDGGALRRAHGRDGDYLQDFEFEEPYAPSPAEHGPELSRPFRGLRLWLPLMMHGAAPFREALAEKLELAERFERGLRARIDAGDPVELVDAPQLSTVAFRLTRRPDEPLPDYDRRNAAWMQAINDRGRVYLSSTALPVADGTAFTLRVCVLSFRTHAEQIDWALDDAIATLPR